MKKAKIKQKKKDWAKGLLLASVIFLIAFVILYIYGYLQRDRDEITNKVNALDSIEKYNYVLNDNVTTYYKDEFQKLKGLEEEQQIAEQVAKLFVIDVYTMSTKFNIYDVGGNEFFYSSKVKMFEQKLIDTMYSTMEDNTYGDRKQELPEVKSITVDSVEETTYEKVDKVDGKEVKEKVDGYKLVLSWDYVKDLGYDTKGIVTVVKDGDLKYSVIEFNTVLTEEKK
jgi:hypothetical protein